MKLTAIATALVLGAAAANAANSSGADITTPERKKALHYIEETNRTLYDAVKNLSDAQWTFKPAPGRWSIAEVVEHMALIQDVVLGVLSKLPTAPAPPEDRDVAKLDAELIAKVTGRTEKFEAPPAARPSGRRTPAAAPDHFKESNSKIRAALETTHDLRAHAIPHPILPGPWDGYQWIIGVVAHTSRHTQQILEVKADGGFPTH